MCCFCLVLVCQCFQGVVFFVSACLFFVVPCCFCFARVCLFVCVLCAFYMFYPSVAFCVVCCHFLLLLFLGGPPSSCCLVLLCCYLCVFPPPLFASFHQEEQHCYVSLVSSFSFVFDTRVTVFVYVVFFLFVGRVCSLRGCLVCSLLCSVLFLVVPVFCAPPFCVLCIRSRFDICSSCCVFCSCLRFL